MALMSSIAHRGTTLTPLFFLGLGGLAGTFTVRAGTSTVQMDY